jgi:hypothetical protein
VKRNEIIKPVVEMTPPGQKTGKIKQVIGNEVEIDNQDGTTTKAPADRLMKDPTTGEVKLGKPTVGQPNQPTSSADQQNAPKSGDEIKLAAEQKKDIVSIKKLAGLR